MYKGGKNDAKFVQLAPRTVLPVEGGVRHVLRLSANSGSALDVGFDSEDDLRDWSRTLTDAIAERKVHVAAAKVVQKRFKICSELSDLVFYSQAAHFRSFEASKQDPFNYMSSFAERKALQVWGFRITMIGVNCVSCAALY